MDSIYNIIYWYSQSYSCKFNTPRNSNIYTPKKSEARTPSTPSPLKTVEKKNVDESENINDKSCCIII